MPNGSPPAGMQPAPLDPRIACLVMRNANPLPWIGSGWWLSRHALVTAAHVLNGATQINTSAGLTPMRRAQAFGFDCAALFFTAGVPHHFGVADPSFGIQTMEVVTQGFAGFDNGARPWLSRGVVALDAQDAMYDAITEAGQSGGPVRLRSTPDLLVGMHLRAGGFLRLSAAVLPALQEWAAWVPTGAATFDMAAVSLDAPAPAPSPGLEPSKDQPAIVEPPPSAAPPAGVTSPPPPPPVPIPAPTQLPGFVLDDEAIFEGRVVMYGELSRGAEEIMAMVRDGLDGSPPVVLYDADSWDCRRAYLGFVTEAALRRSLAGSASGAVTFDATGRSGVATGVGALAEAASKVVSLLRADAALTGRVLSTDTAYLIAELGRHADAVRLIVPQYGVPASAEAVTRLQVAFDNFRIADRAATPPDPSTSATRLDSAIERAGGMHRLLVGAYVDSVLTEKDAAILRVDVSGAGAVRRVRQHLLSRITGRPDVTYRGGIVMAATLLDPGGRVLVSSGFRLVSSYRGVDELVLAPTPPGRERAVVRRHRDAVPP